MISLDTHILIHALAGDLSGREHKKLSSAPWSISAIVLWELAKLLQLGRITLDIDTADFARAMAGIHVWPVDLAVCRRIRSLDFRSDPADEIIAATSMVHNVPLLTRDAKIRRSQTVLLA